MRKVTAKRVFRWKRVNGNTFEEIKKGEKNLAVDFVTTGAKIPEKGDTVIFSDNTDTFATEVKRVSHYKSIKEAFNKENRMKALPIVQSMEDAISFSQMVKNPKCGIVVFQISPVTAES